MPKQIQRPPKWLLEMPKSELHCHLGGSMRLDTILELADKNGVDLSANDRKALRKRVVFKDKAEKSLPAYLEGIAICESVLRTPEDFERAAYEVCQDANNENVNIMELRFGPTNYVTKSLKLHEIVEGALSGLEKATEDFGMHTGLIICGIKTDMEATKKAAEIAINYQDDGVVGFDMAGKERGYRPKLFEEVIKPVLKNFLPVTIHAGEDDTVASIAEALIYLNARRIGHGVSLRESPRVVRYMDEQRVGLEVCPTSNVDTGSVSSISTHPVRNYHREGLRVSINTDNRTISDTNLTKEYMKLINNLGFSQEDIFTIAKHGIKSAFLPSRVSKQLLNDFDDYVDRVKS